MSVQEFSVTSDTEVEDAFRTVTGYGAGVNEVPTDVFAGFLRRAKAKVYSDVGSMAWYTDHHMGEVLVYTTALIAKFSIENYSVEKWSLGNHSISTLQADPAEEGQINWWLEIINENLGESDEVGNDPEADGNIPLLTNNYNW